MRSEYIPQNHDNEHIHARSTRHSTRPHYEYVEDENYSLPYNTSQYTFTPHQSRQWRQDNNHFMRTQSVDRNHHYYMHKQDRLDNRRIELNSPYILQSSKFWRKRLNIRDANSLFASPIRHSFY